ncbi:GNAT family N-acetyltransferase [Nocardioides marinquilinus]|uniref:GNAT family N-acetyltransferase n=1 Tax=Nocardioides marinquilinus TaxID=1210400 RepID=A0ABP9PUY8_9ACTN
MRLRRLEDADHDAVRRILLAAYADHLAVEADYRSELTDVARRDREAEVWVAEDDDGAVVGTVTVCPPDSPWREIARQGEGEFRMLAVDPARQGEGLGRALTRLVVDELDRRGDRAVVLSSTDTMHTAHRLYESLGFVREPERDWKPNPEVSLLAYRKDL